MLLTKINEEWVCCLIQEDLFVGNLFKHYELV